MHKIIIWCVSCLAKAETGEERERQECGSIHWSINAFARMGLLDFMFMNMALVSGKACEKKKMFFHTLIIIPVLFAVNIVRFQVFKKSYHIVYHFFTPSPPPPPPPPPPPQPLEDNNVSNLRTKYFLCLFRGLMWSLEVVTYIFISSYSLRA